MISKSFEDLGASFSRNISAVRVLVSETALLVDEHDRSIIEEHMPSIEAFINDVKNSLPDSDESVEKEKLQDDQSKRYTVETHKEEPSSGSLPKSVDKKIVISDSPQLRSFLHTLNLLKRRPPVQGSLLRNGANVTLVSFFESLIIDLLHLFFEKYPEALPSDSNSLSLAELRTLGTIENAERHLASKEIDSLLRKSLSDVLSYFSKTLKVDLSPLDCFQNELVEIFQRRNLLVHNSGVVNRVYLDNVEDELITKFEASEGKEIESGSNYLKNAVNVIQSAGVILLQQCWRKWEKSERENADNFLLNQLYESLIIKNFHLPIRLWNFSLNVPVVEEATRKTLAVNIAIALKYVDEHEKMEGLLSEFDWTASALRFKVALAVLRDDEKNLCELLSNTVAAAEITEENLHEWPLFMKLRETKRFQDEITRHFPSGSGS